MTKKTNIDAAQLFWGGNALWLGPWKAADVVPVWCGEKHDRAPDRWRVTVGSWENDSAQTHDAAMQCAEHVAMGQLRSIGIRAAEFRRPDGTARRLEMP